MGRAPALELLLGPGSAGPLHRQIAAQLRRAVLERRLAPGTPLPSSRLLARELGCARGTVLAAFEELVLLHRGFDCLGVSRIERGQVGIGYLDSDAPGGAGLA